MKRYSIYQVKDEAPNSRYVRFSSYKTVKDMGIDLTPDMYEKVFEGEIEEAENLAETLENIFIALNVGKKPEGYRGHSLSMSDVIEIYGKFYYVDGIGYKQLNF